MPTTKSGLWTRRRLLAVGAGGAAAVLAGGFELVDQGVLPGKRFLDRIDGACDVATPAETFHTPGPTIQGRFHSRARAREVGYTIAYPPGHTRGSRLPLGVYLHADGGSHTSLLGGLSLARALAGMGLPPIALVAADGGNLYWHPHPGDDPMGMMIDELIPMCQRMRLGTAAGSIGTIGISMGGYGAILFAETHPHLFTACAAIGPAIWTSFAQARGANPGAYTDAAEFARYDAVTHTSTLNQTAVRVASGSDDPFHPGVMALAQRLPAGASVEISAGCHDGAFFSSQRQASLRFLGEHISA